MDTHRLPRSIDEPIYIFIWRSDDAFVPLVGLFAGILANQLLLFLAIGFVSSFVYRRYREGRPNLYIMHCIYWWGFYPDRGHALINPYVREVRA